MNSDQSVSKFMAQRRWSSVQIQKAKMRDVCPSGLQQVKADKFCRGQGYGAAALLISRRTVDKNRAVNNSFLYLQ